MKQHTDLVEEGYQSLLSRFGKYEPDTEAVIDVFMLKIGSSQKNIQDEDVDCLVNQYMSECNFYISKISQMTEYEIEAFIWHIVMRLDIIRGLFPGLKNNDPLQINERLENFENKTWKIINKYFDV
jgi:hypothetical protein